MHTAEDFDSRFDVALFALDALTAGVAVIGAEGEVLAVNDALASFFARTGMSVERHGVGATYLSLYGGVVAAKDAEAVASGLSRLLEGKRGPFRLQYRVNVATGPLWIKLSAVKVGLPQSPFLIVAHEENTAQRNAERSLQDATARLFNVEDDERRRIARELHDSTAQYLTGARLLLGRLKADKSGAKRQIDDLLLQAHGEIRTLTYLLHPPALENLGLAAALRQFAEGLSRRSVLDLRLEIDKTFPRLSRTAEIALYRISQEALANIQRHSGSQRATVGLRVVDDMILLTIRDYGAGMSEEAFQTSGVGFASMRFRLELLNGRLQISNAQPGLRIEAWAPISSAHGADDLTAPPDPAH